MIHENGITRRPSSALFERYEGEVQAHAYLGGLPDEAPVPIWPTDRLEGVCVSGRYHTGIKLRNSWNSTLTDCNVYGVMTEDEYQRPDKTMHVGIDLGNAMDCTVISPRVMSARIGIRAGDVAGPGRAEGLTIQGGWLQHVETGVYLDGEMGGGWPTPSHLIALRHINFLQFGVFAQTVSGLHIGPMDLYASHYRTGQWGIYLVGCKDVLISGLHFWANRPGFFGGIVLDACENVSVEECVLDDAHLTIAIHATARCKNVSVRGASWDRMAHLVVNHAR